MNPITLTRGDTVTLRYQLKEDGAAKDITGMTFRLAVRENISDPAAKIGPVDGVIEDESNGKFCFTLDDTHTDQAPFAGLAEIAMYDAADRKTTLTPAGGLGFRLVEDIVA